MEVADTLAKITKQLSANKERIMAKIKREVEEIEMLTTQQNEIDRKIDVLTSSLLSSEQRLIELNNTIYQTENGYDKILEASKTIMLFAQQSLYNHEERAYSETIKK